MVKLMVYFIVSLVFIDVALLAASTSDSSGRSVKKIRKKKEDRSTSSSSGDDKTDDTRENSLSMTGSSSKSDIDKEKKKKYWQKSSEERHGWRKWHRKCPKCPEARKKWKDPTLMWICGAYQRARRSFKSKCMMEYRNCQDGTMFVKVADYRCPNDSAKEEFPHGDHFFYEYVVKLSDESADTSKTTSTEDETEETSSD